MSVLLISAAGLSSRFNGFPKILSKIGDKTILDNTLELFSADFNEKYIALNEKTLEEHGGELYPYEARGDLHIFPISYFSAQNNYGELYSIYKTLKHIRAEHPEEKEVVIVWGDNIFIGRSVLSAMLNSRYENCAGVCEDPTPYAWFELDEANSIKRSKFKKTHGEIQSGVHDQSIFKFNIEFLLNGIELFMKENNFVEGETRLPNQELRLLNFIEYSYSAISPIHAEFVSEHQVLSFNTTDELDAIRRAYGK